MVHTWHKLAVLASSLSPFKHMVFSTKLEIYKCFAWRENKLTAKKRFTYVGTYTPRVQNTIVVVQKSSSLFFFVIFQKAHIECLGCPNASLLHPTLPYLHLTQNQGCMVAHPTKEPNQFLSSPKYSRSIIVLFSPLLFWKSSQHAPLLFLNNVSYHNNKNAKSPIHVPKECLEEEEKKVIPM